jgi:hypothetical protein
MYPYYTNYNRKQMVATYVSVVNVSVFPMILRSPVKNVFLRAGFEKDMSSSYSPNCSKAGSMLGDCENIRRRAGGGNEGGASPLVQDKFVVVVVGLCEKGWYFYQANDRPCESLRRGRRKGCERR